MCNCTTNLLDKWMLLKIMSDLHAVFVVFLHANRERFDASVHEEAVEWRGDGAKGVLHETKSLVKVVPVHHETSHYDIRMAIDVFCDRVHHNIGAQSQRIL